MDRWRPYQDDDPLGLNVSRAAGGVPGPVTIAPTQATAPAYSPTTHVFQVAVAFALNEQRKRREAELRSSTIPQIARPVPLAPMPAYANPGAAFPMREETLRAQTDQAMRHAAIEQAYAEANAAMAQAAAGTARSLPMREETLRQQTARAMPAPGTQASDPDTMEAFRRHRDAEQARGEPAPVRLQDGTVVASLPFAGPQAAPEREAPKQAGMLDRVPFPDFVSKENALKVGVKALDVLDKPRQVASDIEGQVFVQLAEGKDPGLPFGLADRVRSLMGPDLLEGIRKANEEGYVATDEDGKPKAQFEPGGRAVHEYLMGRLDDEPMVAKYAIRMVVDTFEDPTNWISPLGKIGRGLKAAQRAPDVAGVVKNTPLIERAVGEVLAAPQEALDILSKVPRTVARTTVAGVEKIPGVGKPVEWLAKKSPRTERDEARDLYRRAFDEAAGAEQVTRVLPDAAYDLGELKKKWTTASTNVRDAARFIPDPSRVGKPTERIVDKAYALATAARDDPRTQRAWAVFNDLYDDIVEDGKLKDAAKAGKPIPQRVRLDGVNAIDNLTNVVAAWKSSFGQLGEALPRSVQDAVDGTVKLTPKDPVNWMVGYATATDGAVVKDAIKRLYNAGYQDMLKSPTKGVDAPLVALRKQWKAIKDQGFDDLLPRVEDPSRPLDYVTDEVRKALDERVTSRFGPDQRVLDVLGQYRQETADAFAKVEPLIQTALAAPKMNLNKLAKRSVKDLEKILPLKRAEITQIKDFLKEYQPYVERADDVIDSTDVLARRRASEELANATTGYAPPDPGPLGRVGRGILNASARLARLGLNDATNWDYVWRNVVSNEQMANAPGDLGTLALGEGGLVKNLKRAFRRDISDSPLVEFLDGWNVSGMYEQIIGKRGAAGFEGDRMTGIPEKLLGAEWKGDVTRTLEDIQRAGTAVPLMRDLATERLPKVADDIAALGAKLGAPADEVRRALLDMPIANGPGEVHDLVFGIAERAGVDAKKITTLADRAYRDWTNVTQTAARAAREQTKRRFAIGTERNIDRVLGPVAAFHRWTTRAYPYILEEAIRHPGIVNAWNRAHEEAKEYSAAHPGSLKGTILVATTTPLGLSVFLDPTAFSLVSQLWQMTDMTEPEGLTWLGQKRRQARRLGGGIWPLLDEGLNMTGAYGPEYQTGPINLPSGRLALRLLDVIQTQAGDGFHQPVVLDAMSQAREKISSALSGVVPGAKEVPAGSATGGIERDVREVVASQHPELRVLPDDTPDVAGQKIEALGDVLSDPDHPYVVQAEKDLALGRLGQQVWNESPFGVAAVRTRPTARFEREVRENTGMALPTDEIESKLVTTTPEATRGLMQEADYKAIGTQAQRDANDLWTDIAYGEAPPTVAYVDANGETQFVKGAEIAALTEDQRKQVADSVLAGRGEAGFTEPLRQQRDQFRAANPAFDDFKTWQTNVPDDTAAYREDLRQNNPNAARAIADQEAYLATQEEPGSPAYLDRLDGWTRSRELYNAIQGIKTSVYDPNPTSTRSAQSAAPYDPAGAGGGTTGDFTPFPGGGNANPAAQLRLEQEAYSRGMDIVDATLTRLNGQPIRYADIGHPDLKAAARSQLAMAGVPMPTPGPNLTAYWDWKDVLPPGSDDSMEAYARWQQTGGWPPQGPGTSGVPGQTSADAYAHLDGLLGVPTGPAAAPTNPALNAMLQPPPRTGNPVVQLANGMWAEHGIMGLPRDVVRVNGLLYRAAPNGQLTPWQ
jgi:hypothetical protein